MTHTTTYAKQPLNVIAKVWDSQPLTLSEHVASGKTPDGDEFDINRNAVSQEFYIKFKGQVYEVGLYAIMDALIEVTKNEKH